MFEPSKFVYSFFAFNTLYNYDWENSIIKNRLIPFSIEEKLSESHKFKKMVDFIFEHFEENDSMNFVNFILKPNKRQEPKTKEHLIKALEGITPDNRISDSERKEFKKEFKKLLENKTLLKGKLKHDILRFIYLVRNNIFHGTKTTIDMAGTKQRERLDIYSNILIATNDLLFKSLERKLKFSLDKKYTIKL